MKRNQRGSSDVFLVLEIIGFVIMCIVGVISAHGVSDPLKAERTLTNAGYTDIKVGGSSWFACGGDWYNTTYVAKSPGGQSVTGTVCSGFLFKNSTIRFD